MRFFANWCSWLLCVVSLAGAESRVTKSLLLSGGDYERGRGFCAGHPSEIIKLISTEGREIEVSLARAKAQGAQAVSENLTPFVAGLKEGELKDLVTYISTAPPLRHASEIESVRKANASGEEQHSPDRHLHIVLVASSQDHPAGQHDYPAWQRRWAGLLKDANGVEVGEAQGWPSPAQFSKANVIVFYFWNHEWTAERYAQLDSYLAKGGGLAFFHAAVIADKEPEKLAERIGLAAQPGPTKYLHTPLDLEFSRSKNPVSVGYSKLKLLDEPYWPMIGDKAKVRVLASTFIEGEDHPQVWMFQKAKGRVFCSIIGHYSWTWSDPLFQILAFRGVAWAAGERTERFDALQY
jgi:type 1 glutamine amidotransferase